MIINIEDRSTVDRNPYDGTMDDRGVTAFLISPHYRIYRHILLQLVVLLITINVFWYEPLQTVSFWRRWGGCLAYFLSMDAVIYTNLHVLVPRFLLKNRLGSYVLAAIITNLVVITFLSVTQGLLLRLFCLSGTPMDLLLSSMPFRAYLLWGLLPQVRRQFHCSLIGCVIICVLINLNLPLCNLN